MSIPIRPVIQDKTRIDLGKRGENEAQIIQWATLLPTWRETYGAGTVVLLHRRQGDAKPYPATIQVEGDNIDWPVTAADTAREGLGLCELQYVVGDTVVKTERWETLVRCSLEKPGPAPEPSGGWVQQMVAQTDAAVAAGLAELQEAGTAGLEELQEAGETARASVEEARSQAEQQLAGMAQSYSKGESDGRYVPVESALTVSASGDDLVTLSPTVPWALQGLKLFGRTVQDGVPSPEQPVPLVSAGEDGSVNPAVTGANLANPSGANPSPEFINGVTIVNNDGVISATGTSTVTSGAVFTYYFTGEIKLPKGCYFAKDCNVRLSKNGSVVLYVQPNRRFFFDPDTYDTARFYVQRLPQESEWDGITYVDGEVIYPAVFVGETTQPWAPYQSKSLTLSPPNGLPGIPVNSGGNYTDQSGQQWICDEIDFTSGYLTSRVQKCVVDGTYNITVNDQNEETMQFACSETTNPPAPSNLNSFNGGVISSIGQGNHLSPGAWIYQDDRNYALIVIAIPRSILPEQTLDGFLEWLSANPVTVLYAVKDVTTQPIDAETMAAYQALQSYSGTTNVICDGVGIQATALADANQLISTLNQRLAALESAQTQI